MSTPVDERLRDALGAQAAATTVDPDGWERIRRRTARRRPAWARPGLVAPALAVVALVLGAVALAPGDDASRLRAAAPPGRLYLVPTLPGFALANVVVDPDLGSPAPSRRLRVFGRPAADGVTFAASAVVTVGDPLEPVQDLVDGRAVSWREGDRAVSLTTFGLSDAEAAAVEASLRAFPADVAPPDLPPGFVTVVDEVLPVVPARFVHQTWRNASGSFDLVVAEDARARLDVLAAQAPGAAAARVRGTDGLLLPEGGGLTWLERPSAAVTVFGPGLGPAELRAVAESLEPVDEAAWRRLIAGVPSGQVTGPPAVPVGEPETVTIGEGEADGVAWQAMVHPASSPGGGPERCVLVKTSGGSGGFCHDESEVTEPGSAEVTLVQGRFLAGRVGAGVARVRVLLAGGATVEAVPAGPGAGIGAGYLVVVLPAGSATEAVVTLDEAGRELTRRPLPPPSPAPARSAGPPG